MPIKPEKRKLYPENWATISLLQKEQAGWKCQLCFAEHDKRHPHTGSFVVLTTHHINGDPTDNRRINLIALCQRCHNILDMPFRHKKRPNGELFHDCLEWLGEQGCYAEIAVSATYARVFITTPWGTSHEKRGKKALELLYLCIIESGKGRSDE